MINRSTLCVILSVAFFSSVPHLAIASDFQSPRTAALGGAGHAGPMLNDAIYLNPSFASFLPAYSVGLNYGFFTGADRPDGTVGDPHGHVINASLQDGRTELFQAGMAFTQTDDRRIFNFGASRAFVKKFGVGLGGKAIFPLTNNASIIWDSILSVSFVPFEWLQTSFIVDNLIESAGLRAMGLNREFILGTKFNAMGIVLIYFDPHLAPNAPDVPGSGTYGFEGGVEFPFFRDFFLRLGAFRNAYQQSLTGRGRGYSAGLGWIAPRISFDYGLSRVLEPVVATAHNFGITIYF